jgi:CheY-like chemotaxis protein
MQPGTGLGLAIVNSIVRSESINGQVDISSTEGVGTEIRVTFDAAHADEDRTLSHPDKMDILGRIPTVTLIGFDPGSRGNNLLREVLIKYLTQWWGFSVVEDSEQEPADIALLNEDVTPMLDEASERGIRRPFVLLTSTRLDTKHSAIHEFDRMGGFCRVVTKPVGPSRLRQVLRACIQWVAFREGSARNSPTMQTPDSQRSATMSQFVSFGAEPPMSTLISRHASQEGDISSSSGRPRMMTRAKTYHPLLRTMTPSAGSSQDLQPSAELPSSPGNSTVIVGNGGTLLKSSIGTFDAKRGRTKVLIIEDNKILRELLCVYLPA